MNPAHQINWTQGKWSVAKGRQPTFVQTHPGPVDAFLQE